MHMQKIRTFTASPKNYHVMIIKCRQAGNGGEWRETDGGEESIIPSLS